LSLQTWPSARELMLDVLVGALLAQLALLVTSVYAHRHLAHRSVDFHPSVRRVMRYVAPFVVGLRLRRWCGAHRLHHAHVDDPEFDPHSPAVYGRWKVILFTSWYYLEFTRRHRDLVATVAGDVEANWVDQILGDARFRSTILFAGLAPFVGIVSAIVIISTELLLRALILGGLNGLHRPPPVSAIRDSRLLILVAAGEGYHERHHEHPGSYTFASGRLPDLGAIVIKGLLRVGLASSPTDVPETAG
jgi:stearoyl-CoA desaturase (delta-9 desaturase)